jgi:malonate transporter
LHLQEAADMTANTILPALAPIFFVILVGYGPGRLRIVENHHVDGLNALVMNFALPASLFVATASAPRSEMLEQAPRFLILGFVMLRPMCWGGCFQRSMCPRSSRLCASA